MTIFILTLAVGVTWTSALLHPVALRKWNHPGLLLSGRSGRTRGLMKASDSGDDDMITRLFKRFLPTPEEMGLGQISVDTAPEQYYCTKERWADPVDGDDETVQLFRPALAQTNFEKRKLKLAYDGSENGWDADKFHDCLDAQGPAVVFARCASGAVVGGYNPKGWVNYGEFRASLAAFLFTWPDGNTEALPTKISKVAGAGLAQVDDGSGPKFGMDDLAIPLNSNKNPRLIVSKLGSYYERMPGGEQSLFGARNDELLELKVYIGVYGEDEFVPNTEPSFASIT